MHTILLALLLAQGAPYYPPAHDWQRQAPAEAGIDVTRLDQAIAFAKANENRQSRDLEMVHHTSFGREPYGQPVGPFQPRGDMTGVILRRGYLVAEWGEPDRVDMTFSATKSFLDLEELPAGTPRSPPSDQA